MPSLTIRRALCASDSPTKKPHGLPDLRGRETASGTKGHQCADVQRRLVGRRFQHIRHPLEIAVALGINERDSPNRILPVLQSFPIYEIPLRMPPETADGHIGPVELPIQRFSEQRAGKTHPSFQSVLPNGPAQFVERLKPGRGPQCSGTRRPSAVCKHNKPPSPVPNGRTRARN